VAGWSLAPLVEALQALRGVGLVIAATLVAEIGDLSRFESPKQLMSWLGLVPSERSSSTRRRQGGITKSGNGHARTMLIEAGWSCHAKQVGSGAHSPCWNGHSSRHIAAQYHQPL
jgi:transposase